MNSPSPSPRHQHDQPILMAKAGLVLAGAVLLGTALAVPFVYETQTLWYKTGMNKIMLRTGQLFGMLALTLIVVQILLALRPKVLARSFGGTNLLRWHQTNGVLIAVAAMGHVGLVLAPEGWENLPIGRKHWPEMIGGVLFFLLLATVLISRFRSKLRLDFAAWRQWHKLSGYLVLLLVIVHVLFVSESFTQGLPRVLLLAVAIGLASIVILTKTARNRSPNP